MEHVRPVILGFRGYQTHDRPIVAERWGHRYEAAILTIVTQTVTLGLAIAATKRAFGVDAGRVGTAIKWLVPVGLHAGRVTWAKEEHPTLRKGIDFAQKQTGTVGRGVYAAALIALAFQGQRVEAGSALGLLTLAQLRPGLRKSSRTAADMGVGALWLASVALHLHDRSWKAALEALFLAPLVIAIPFAQYAGPKIKSAHAAKRDESALPRDACWGLSANDVNKAGNVVWEGTEYVVTVDPNCGGGDIFRNLRNEVVDEMLGQGNPIDRPRAVLTLFVDPDRDRELRARNQLRSVAKAHLGQRLNLGLSHFNVPPFLNLVQAWSPLCQDFEDAFFDKFYTVYAVTKAIGELDGVSAKAATIKGLESSVLQAHKV